jgi:hypothetical protein
MSELRGRLSNGFAQERRDRSKVVERGDKFCRDGRLALDFRARDPRGPPEQAVEHAGSARWTAAWTANTAGLSEMRNRLSKVVIAIKHPDKNSREPSFPKKSGRRECLL